MNPIIKKAYKAEFETSNISIPDICKKYNIIPEDLGDTSDWEKRASEPNTDIIVIDKEEDITPSEIVDTDDCMLDDIREIKKLALDSTRQFFQDYDTNEVSTKEFKDMVGVLKDIESGELVRQGVDKGPTVNILVQNMVERFKDDC